MVFTKNIQFSIVFNNLARPKTSDIPTWLTSNPLHQTNNITLLVALKTSLRSNADAAYTLIINRLPNEKDVYVNIININIAGVNYIVLPITELLFKNATKIVGMV